MPLQLIAGLGNPGSEYAGTRHNAGFRFLDLLLEGRPERLKPESRFHGELARVSLHGCEVWLLKPTGFMNRSGEAVSAVMNFYKFSPADVLVVHDELDLSPGTVRLKTGGGAGGHNGVTDVIEKIGGEFHRLRVGIGRPATSAQMVSFVLRRAPGAEAALTENALRESLTHLEDIVHGRFSRAMNALHTHASTPSH